MAIKILLTTLVLVLGSSQLQASPVGVCSTSDFTAGDSFADACHVGETQNADLGDISTLWDGGWTEAAKYEEGSGLEDGALIDLDIWVADDGLFGWSIPAESLGTFEDAVFVVKQANFSSNNPGGWVAYLFQPLLDAMGNFMTENSFAVDDYSHVSLYIRGDGHEVPEMDAASSALALALLAGIMGWVRERKK